MTLSATFVLFVVVFLIRIPDSTASIEPKEFLTRLEAIINERFNFLLQLVLPQIPNEYSIDGPMKFNWPGLITMDGSIKNGFITGLPTTQASVLVSPLDSTISFSLLNDHIRLAVGKYDVSGFILTTGTRFNGSGSAIAEIKNIDVNIFTKLSVDSKTERLSVADTNINIKFASLHVEISNLEINGVVLEWDVVNQKIREDFEKEWASAKVEIQSKLENEINRALEDLSTGSILRILES